LSLGFHKLHEKIPASFLNHSRSLIINLITIISRSNPNQDSKNTRKCGITTSLLQLSPTLLVAIKQIFHLIIIIIIINLKTQSTAAKAIKNLDEYDT